MSWRLPFILLASLSFVFSISCYLLLPHSPRWLKLSGHPAKAAETWDYLGVSQAEREKVEVEQYREEVSLATRYYLHLSNASNSIKKDRRYQNKFLVSIFEGCAWPYGSSSFHDGHAAA